MEATAQTVKFLRFLFEPYDADLSIEIRSFKPEWATYAKYGPREWFNFSELDRCERLVARIRERYEVYFGVLPRTWGQGDSEHLRAAAFLWIDFDAGDGTREETLAFLLAAVKHLGIPPPNVLVCSGGGYHAYWRLAEVVPLGTEEEREKFRAILRRFVLAVGGELSEAHACPKATDCARILRPVGSLNLKVQGSPRPVELVRCKPGEEKPLVWWTGTIPPEPCPPEKPRARQSVRGGKDFELPWLSSQMEAWLTAPVPKGERHYKLVDVAARMRMHDQSEDATFRILATKAANSGVNVADREQIKHLEEIVAWVFSHVRVDENRPIFYRGVKIGS